MDRLEIPNNFHFYVTPLLFPSAGIVLVQFQNPDYIEFCIEAVKAMHKL